MGLSIKAFGSGDDEGNQGLDFKDLENNPNYNPEGNKEEPSGEPEGEPIDDKSTVEPKGEAGDDNGEPNGASDGEPSGEPKSSLNNDEPKEDEPIGLSDEDYFKDLSEKLGREVKSFDDLKQNVENPLDKDPYLKSLSEWRDKTGRPLEDWIKFQKDYTDMGDLDVAREFLQLKYPELDESSIELELEQYIALDEDLDREQAMKNLQLKKLAIEGRKELGKLKSALDLPDNSNLHPDIQEKLKFIDDIKAQLKAGNDSQKDYDTNIAESSSKLDTLELNLGGDTKLDFKVSDEDRSQMPKMIAEMPQWKNEDGSWNHKAVVEDGLRLKHFDKMMQLAYEQGVNSGTEGVIKDAKNSTLGDQKTNGSQQGNKQKGDIIEGGIDELLDKKTLKFRF